MSSENTRSAPDHASAAQHRKTLLGEVDLGEWNGRLESFMALQPGVTGAVVVSDLSLPSAGGSSGTILFSATYDTAGGERETRRFVLRYATEGGLFHSYDLPGQYAILEGLQGSGVAVPSLFGIDRDGAVLGVTGYVMGRLDGEAPPSTYHNGGLLADASETSRRAMIEDVLANLARLHALDSAATAFKFLRHRGTGATAQERDIDWMWSSLMWGCPAEQAALEPIRGWLIANQPPERKISVNHGDAMMANYMFVGEKVVGVIDWELAFLGNPACDIAYQVQTNAFLGMGGALLPGIPTEEEWKAAYERISGKPLEYWEYCSAVTAFKLHISLLLVYREIKPEMIAARDAVLGYTHKNLMDRWATAKLQTA